MRLRHKLLFAQLPLLLALAVTGIVGNLVTRDLAESGRRILHDNYRSVLAAQRMKDAAERLDSGALFVVAGRRELGLRDLEQHRQAFRSALQVETENITEEGETDAAAALSAAWAAYDAGLTKLATAPPAQVEQLYFDELHRRFLAVKDAADVILGLNQDAMVRKGDAVDRRAARANALVVGAALLGALLGVLGSVALTTRLLSPLSILALTARRIGQGDLAVRARIDPGDEIGDLAAEFNVMADRLEEYRRSSLGELLEVEQQAQSAIDSLPDPVLILRGDGTVVQANEAASRLLRIETDQSFRGAPLEVRPVIERLHDHSLAGRGAYSPSLEEALRMVTDGGERAFLPRATPIHTEAGALAGTAIVFQDVTRLLRADELRSNLVATVAHEFRTPLTSLRLAVHLCVEEAAGPLTEKQKDLLHTARQDCERLQTTIDELLDLSRIRSGRVEVQRRPLVPREVLRQVHEQHADAAAQRHVGVELSTAPDLEVVDADPERLQVILGNLLSNAIRHSPEGASVAIRVAGRDGNVRFEVSDQGPGVPEEFKGRIFERSFQVPGAQVGAAGLGLFIAKDFVQAHGGTIGVDSAPGAGATFWFELPANSPQGRVAVES